MAGRRVVQLLDYTELATNRQYLVALTECGRIFCVQRELFGPGAGPLNWTEIISSWPVSVPSAGFVGLVWVAAGNYLLGLKDDGTVWKCTSPNADPLVWVSS